MCETVNMACIFFSSHPTYLNMILTNLEKRLAGLKKIYLSKRGKEVLIKSALSSIATYSLSLFLAPAIVTIRFERLQRNFLWDSTEGGEAVPLGPMETVTISKHWGGFGVKDPRIFNKALSGKWLWRFGSEVRTFWREVIGEKYGVLEGEWRTKVIIMPFGLYYGGIY